MWKSCWPRKVAAAPVNRGWRIRGFAIAAAATAGILASLADGRGGSAPSPGYVTSEKCAACHQIQYKGWVKTFHSTVVQDAKKDPAAVMGDMSDPELPFRKEDIHLTIGGHWDQRYLTRIEDDYYILPRLWSVQSKKWRPYSTYGWQKRPYSKYCVGCHSVGFDPATKQTVEHAVGCESCHGKGSLHAEKPERGNIVNPKRLTEERAAEICASCHVRGKDRSGEYFFPIGYVPGDDLAKFLAPIEKNEGERDHDAIHRLWEKWKTDREAQSRARCEVCGIHQNVKPQGRQVSLDQVCMSCHDFDEKRLLQHTRHGKPESAGCTDCHHQKDPELNETKDGDVHSYSFFLIHPQGCWDKEIQNRCGKCHADKPANWAYDTVLRWKKPVVIDH